MESKKIDIVCYLSNGYPSKEKTLSNAAAYIKGGCDVIEVDLPNDNPYIDGPLLQERMIASYKNDQSLESHIQTIYALRENHPTQRFIILVYEKTIKKLGIEYFIKIYKENAIEAVILVDNQDNKIKNLLMKKDVKIVSYITQEMRSEDINNAKESNGFVYLQARAGKENDEAILSMNRETIKDIFPDGKKVYAGVGISTPEDVKMAKRAKVDGVFVGSAVFTKEDDQNAMIDFIQSLKESA